MRADATRGDRFRVTGIRESESAEGMGEPSGFAKRLAGGHSREKHYPGLTEEELAQRIQDVIDNFDRSYPAFEGAPSSGRKIWIKGKTVVIRDPANPDGGTVFEPRNVADFVRTFIRDNP